jgi:hypothetical protein
MPPVFCNVRELGERLDVSPETVRDWERLGVIPSVRTGRRIFFNLESLRTDARPGLEVAAANEAN